MQYQQFSLTKPKLEIQGINAFLSNYALNIFIIYFMEVNLKLYVEFCHLSFMLALEKF